MSEDLPSQLTEEDVSRLGVRRSVLRLALPALGEQVLNYCVGLFDTFLAGRVHASGMEAGVSTSAVGIAAYVSWLGTLLFALVGTGTMVLVARSWGAGDYREGNRFANCATTLAGFAGVAVFTLLYLIAPGYAHLQHLRGESFDIVVTFLRTDAIGQIFYSFCLIGSAALRGVGDMRSPMLILGLVNILNMAVSTTLVFGLGPIPAMGIRGIVTGTVVAKIIGGLIMLATLTRGVSGLQLHWSLLRPLRDDVRRILRIGLPAAADGFGTWAGHSVFLMIVSSLGTPEQGKSNLAAHIIGIQVEALSYLPATAWGYAAATLIGQALGARHIQRARRIGHEAAWQCGWMAGGAALVYLLAAPLIYAVMTSEPLVRQVGVPALRFLSWYQIPLVVLIVYMNALRGAGDTRTTFWINVLGIGLIRLPVAWLFGIYFDWGLIGAWGGMTIDVTCRALLTWLRYTHGQWTKLQV